MTLLMSMNLGFAWGEVAPPADSVDPWTHHESRTGFGTHASGQISIPTVIRNTDVHQAYYADIDE